jgi:hypothetical protein
MDYTISVQTAAWATGHAAQAIALPDFDGNPELARAIIEIIAANLRQRAIAIAGDASTTISGRISRQDGRHDRISAFWLVVRSLRGSDISARRTISTAWQQYRRV